MSFTFHKPSLKLTGLYLAVLMAISLFFSAIIYQASVAELDRGLRRPGRIYEIPIGEGFPRYVRDQLLAEQEAQYTHAKEIILNRLIVLNILILLGGGALSYYLALRTLKPIEEAHESLERFTADASHELRTPITAMRTENEVALMDPKLTLKDAKAQIASNIEELNKLTQLTEGLLRLAQIDNQDLERTIVTAEEIVTEAVMRVTPHTKKANVIITQKITATTSILADKSSIIEALVTLLDNAIKYSPEGTAVTIAADQHQKQLRIQVGDEGVGISSDELPHIFERFYRADSSRTKQKIHGYGLGLAIAKSIVEAHDGTLTAASKPGKGSTFTLSLPTTTS